MRNGLHEYIQCEINYDGTLGKTNIISTENDIWDLNGKEEHVVINSLLAKSRIEKYTENERNGYVGFIGRDLKKYAQTMFMKQPNETKNYTREDGTNLTLKKESSQPFLDRGIHSYKCCEFVVEPNGKVQVVVNNIHSETDIKQECGPLYDTFFATHSLSRERINSKVEYGAGYVGTVTLKDARLMKAASPQTLSIIQNATINQQQNFTTSELQNSMVGRVNGADYQMIRDTFGNQVQQTSGYSMGFVSYKNIIIFIIVTSVILLILYVIIKLFF